jgi:hypothetical protein
MCFARVDMAGKVIIGGDGERWSGVVLYPGSVLGGGDGSGWGRWGRFGLIVRRGLGGVTRS